MSRSRLLGGWLPTLVLMFGLGIGAEARAGGKVDWSEYLEPPGSRPMPVKSSPTVAEAPAAEAPAAKTTARSKKASRTKVAKATKSSPKGKKKAARSGRRG